MKTGWVILFTVLGVFLILALIGWSMRKGAQLQTENQVAGGGATAPTYGWNPETDLGGNGVLL